jgi:hypothetical protein
VKQEGILTWDLLQSNLTRQVDAYQRLDQLLASENKILIDHKVEKLIELTPKKEQLNQEIRQLREDYFHLVKQIVVSERPDRITVEELIAWAPVSYHQALSVCQHSLELLARDIHKKNKINQGLLDQSMRYVTYMVKKIIELNSSPQQVYCQRGYSKFLGEQQTLMSVVA